MARLRIVLLAVTALVLAGYAVAQFKRPNVSEPAVGSVCRSRSGEARRTCYKRVLTGHLQKYGVSDAVATLDAFAAADSDVEVHAHEYAHGIGRLAYSVAPDVATTFVACGDRAASGCRHGFMQAYLESRQRVTATDLQSFCKPLESEQYNRWLLSQCLHGLGHGLTMFRDHDAPRALRDCELLTTEWQRQSCYGGVFMESFVNATVPHEMASGEPHHHAAAFKAVDSTDLLYPCSIMAQRYLYACYQMQTTVMLYLNGGDVGAAARACDRAPAAMHEACYESLGRDVTTYASQDPRKAAQLCAQASAPSAPSAPSRGTCYGSAARSLVNWDGRLDGALELCRVVGTNGSDSTDAAVCYWYLGNTISMLFATAPERDAACARISETAALASCRRGARGARLS
jgi:hypothetical protein